MASPRVPTKHGPADVRSIVARLRGVDPTNDETRHFLQQLVQRFPALAPRDAVWLTTYTIQKALYEPTLPPAARGALRQQAEIIRDKSILRVVASAADFVKRAGLFPRIIVPPLVIVPPSCEPNPRAGGVEHVMRALLADYADWMLELNAIVRGAFSSTPSTGARAATLCDVVFALVGACARMDEQAWRSGARSALKSVKGKLGAEHLTEQDVLDQIAHLVDRGREPFWRGAGAALHPNWREARDALGVPRERKTKSRTPQPKVTSLDRPTRRSLDKTLLDVIAASRAAASQRSVLDAVAAAEQAGEAENLRAAVRAAINSRLARARQDSAAWHALRNALLERALSPAELARATGKSKAALSEAWSRELAALRADESLRRFGG